MLPPKINITVLVAPLDWGLGHCTRCIPLIAYLNERGCKVLLATEGAPAKLLSQEFPELTLLPLKGYRIRYSSAKRWFSAKILWQLPKIVLSIKNEHKWLKRAVQEHQIDIIISDNRYGLHHPETTSIFITHQLQVQTPFAWAESMVQQRIYKYINRFHACWVPDLRSETNLAGKLAHPFNLPAVPVFYIGPLSRMENQVYVEKKWDVLVLLSGPEPQRTMLENLILEQVKNRKDRILLVRGLPLSTDPMIVDGMEVINHLPSNQLQETIQQSAVVISRSGYSTVMDLCKLEKCSILIPTPGQTEQEYLAKYLSEKSWCYYYEQEGFDLSIALVAATNNPRKFPFIKMNDYKQALDDLLNLAK